jgi:hypothetical protein
MENEDDLRKITRDIRHCDASKIRHIKSNWEWMPLEITV